MTEEPNEPEWEFKVPTIEHMKEFVGILVAITRKQTNPEDYCVVDKIFQSNEEEL